MKIDLAERHWLVSAAVMAVAVPACAVGGLAFTLAVAFVVEKVGLAEKIPLYPWLWLFGLAVTSTVLWFLARWFARAGGWRALGTGFVICALAAAALWLLGDIEQRLQPDNSMAAVGGPILGIMIALFALVALFCGVIAILTNPARQVPALDSDEE